MPCVLIVDDDRGAVDAFEPMLTARGYRVRVALDAEAGLSEISRSVPSAIVLDFHLPTMNAIEFLRRLDPCKPRIPVAVVTGDYLIDTRVPNELESLGAKLFFKPLWEEDLIRIVGSLIRNGCQTCPGGGAPRDHQTAPALPDLQDASRTG